MTRVTTPVPETYGADFIQAYKNVAVKPANKKVYLDGSCLVHLPESLTIDGIRQEALAVCSRHFELAPNISVTLNVPAMTCVMVKNEVLEKVAECKEPILWGDLREQRLRYVIAWYQASANDEMTRPLLRSGSLISPDYMSGRWFMQTKGRGTRMKAAARGTATVICWDKEDWASWFKKLDDLRSNEGWDGGKAGPPNEVSIKNANVFVECLQQAEWAPKQIAPSVVGGVGVTIRDKKKKVYVEFTNKGAVIALFSDSETPPAVEKIPPGATNYFSFIDKAKAYLNE
jgi:hypothetical protein